MAGHTNAAPSKEPPATSLVCDAAHALINPPSSSQACRRHQCSLTQPSVGTRAAPSSRQSLWRAEGAAASPEEAAIILLAFPLARAGLCLSIPQTVPGKAGQTRRLNTNQVFSCENSLFSWPLLPSVCLSVLPGWLTVGQRGAYTRAIISSSTSFSRRISWHHPPSPARVVTFVPFPAASCLGHFFVSASSPTCATETNATVPGASSK